MDFLIAALLPGFLLLSCTRGRDANNADPPPVPVTTYQVGLQKVNLSESYPATVTALKQVELRAQVTGYITGILFTEGSRVGEGQRLYEIDRRQYEAAFQQATLNLQIAQENQERIQRDVDRYTMLNEHEAISRQIYDNALTDLANAKLQVSVATQELVKARTNLDFSVIKAPFDGTITDLISMPGDQVGLSTTAFRKHSSLSRVRMAPPKLGRTTGSA